MNEKQHWNETKLTRAQVGRPESSVDQTLQASLVQNTTFGTSKNPEGFVKTWKEATHLWRWRAVLCIFMSLLLAMMQPSGNALYRAWGFGNGFDGFAVADNSALTIGSIDDDDEGDDSSLTVAANDEYVEVVELTYGNGAHFFPDWTYAPNLTEWYYAVERNQDDDYVWGSAQSGNTWAQRNNTVTGGYETIHPVEEVAGKGMLVSTDGSAVVTDYLDSGFGPNANVPMTPFWYMGYSLKAWTSPLMSKIAAKDTLGITSSGQEKIVVAPYGAGIEGRSWDAGSSSYVDTHTLYHGTISITYDPSKPSQYPSSIPRQNVTSGPYVDQYYYGDWRMTDDYTVSLAMPEVDGATDEFTGGFVEISNKSVKYAWDSPVTPQSIYAGSSLAEEGAFDRFFTAGLSWELYTEGTTPTGIVVPDGTTLFGELVNPNQIPNAKYDPRFEETVYSSKNLGKNASPATVYLVPNISISYYANGGNSTDGVDTSVSIPLNSDTRVRDVGSDTYIYEPYVQFANEPTLAAWKTVKSNTDVGFTPKEGKKFAGWSTTPAGSAEFTLSDIENGALVTSNGVLQSSINLYAVWVDDDGKATLSYNKNGHGQDSDVPEAEKDTAPFKATEPADMSDPNYTFGGWYTDAGCTNAWDFAVDEVEADMTLYAKWTPKQYTISFDMGGHGTQIAPKTLDYDTEIGAVDDPTESGWVFDGWFEEDSYDTEVEDIASEKVLGNKVYYAKWTKETPKTYAVKFMAKSSASSSYSELDSVDVEQGAVITAAAAPTPSSISGYSFIGWSTSQNYPSSGKLWNLTSDPVPANMSLYAYYVADNAQFTVTFYGWNEDGDWDKVGEQPVNAGEPIRTIIAYSHYNVGDTDDDGNPFYGWTNTNSVGDSPSTNATLWDIANSPVNGDMNLCEVWGDAASPDEMVTVTYEVAQGNDVAASNVSDIPESKTISSGSKIGQAPAKEPTTSGWTFSGWYTTADRTTLFDFANTEITQNTTIYAKWVESEEPASTTYEVKFMDKTTANGAYSQTKVVDVEKNQVVTSAAAPSANEINNYTFMGWYTGENGTGSEWDLTATPVTAATTLYAYYIAKDTEYIVTFYGWNEDGDWDKVGEQPVKAGDPIRTIIAYSHYNVGDTDDDGNPFYGWTNTNSVGDSPSTNATLWDIANSPVNGDMNLCEVWGDAASPDEMVTVTYEVAQGNDVAASNVSDIPESKTISSGSKIGQAPAKEPTTSGWAFSGWYTTADRTTLFDFANTEITQNTTIYAKWVVDPSSLVNVTFDLQGVGDPQPAKQKIPKNTVATEPTAPTAPNLTFGGWYQDADCTQGWNFTSTVAADKTLYAKWTAAISFNNNGHGGGAPATVNVLYNTVMPSASIPNNPTDNDYVFDGWYTSATGGTQIDLSTYTHLRNRTLYAHWTQKTKYNVTFMANGHGSAPAVQQIVEGEKASKPATMTADDGYDHDGNWYTSSSCNPNDLFDFNTAITEATTLYAKWTPHEYSITYLGMDDATVADPGNPTTYTVKTNGVITLINPTKTNYTFKGWSGDGLTGDENKTVTIDPATKADLTFTANWTKDEFTVKFNLQGHGDAIADQKVGEGDKVTAPTPPTADGWAFKGWYREAACTNAWNFSSDTVTTNPTTLYAKWVKVHTVTFQSNGGSDVDSQQVEDGAKATAPGSNPTREHYDFVRWCADEDLDTPANFNNAIKADTTFYAKWSPKNYTVSFNTDGGSTAPTAQTVAYNGKATEPESVPTKAGYTFDAWYYNNAAYDFDSPVTGDIELTAHYTADAYTVTLALGKGTIDGQVNKAITTTAAYGDKTNALGWAAALATVALPSGYAPYSNEHPGTWDPADPTASAINITEDVTYTWTPDLLTYTVTVATSGANESGFTISNVPAETEYKDIKFTGTGAARAYDKNGTALAASLFTPDADHRDSGSWTSSATSGSWEALSNASGKKVTGNLTLTYTFDKALRGVTLKVVGGTYNGEHETVISSDVSDGTYANTLITQAMINSIVPDDAAQYTVTGGTWGTTGDPTDAGTVVSGSTIYTYTLATRTYDVTVTPENASTSNTVTIKNVPYGTAYNAIKYTGSGNTLTYSESGTALTGAMFTAASGYEAPGTWSGTGISSPAASATPPSDVTVAGATALTYTFEPSKKQVTVTVTGGTLGGKSSYTITDVPYGTPLDAIAFNPTATGTDTYAFQANGTTLASLTPVATTDGDTPYVADSGRWNGGGMTNAASLDGTKTISEATALTYTFKRNFKVTFHMNEGGTWSNNTNADITVYVTEGNKLPAASVPTGMKPTEGYYKGTDTTASQGSWNAEPNTTTALAGDVTYNYTFKKVHTITYAIVNGKWSDTTTANKTEYIFNGDTLASVPTGSRTTTGFAETGTWTDATPVQGTTVPSGDTTYTLTFAPQKTSYKVEYYVQKVNAASNTVPSLSGAEADVFEAAGTPATKVYEQYNSVDVKAGDTVQFDAADIVEIDGFTPITSMNPSAGDELTLDGTAAHDVYKVYYSRNKYTLSYAFTNNAGDTAVPSTAQLPASVDYYVGATYTVDTTQPTLATNSNGKYTFSGWGETGTQTMPAANKELRGTWTAGTVAITYVNANTAGGSLNGQATADGQYGGLPFVTQNVTLGSSVTPPTATPVGSKVLRWTSDAQGNTITSVPTTATDSVVLYAQWVDPIAISYSPDAEGIGTFAPRSVRLTIADNSTSSVENVPTFATTTDGFVVDNSQSPDSTHQKGYEFKGWVWDGQAIPMTTPTPVGSTTTTSYAFVAVYDALSHDVFFDNTAKPTDTTAVNTYLSGADTQATLIDSAVTNASTIALPTTTQVKADGYDVSYEVFVAGNNTKVDTLSAGQTLTITPAYLANASSEGATVTIKAVYTKKNYNVTYSWSPDTIDSDLLPESATKAYKAEVTLPEVSATVEGYKFTGWTTTDATIANGKFTMPANDVAVVGTWAKKNYKIQWQVNPSYASEIDLATNEATNNADYGTQGSAFTVPVATTKDGVAIGGSNGKYTAIDWKVGETLLSDYTVPTAASDSSDPAYDGVITVVGTPTAASNYTIFVRVTGGKLTYNSTPDADGEMSFGSGGDVEVAVSYGQSVADVISGLAIAPDTANGYSGDPVWKNGKNPFAEGEKVTGSTTYEAVYSKGAYTVTYKLPDDLPGGESGKIELTKTSDAGIEHGTATSTLTFPTLQNVGENTLVGTKYESTLTWTPDDVDAITGNQTFTGTPKLKKYTVKLKLSGAEFTSDGTNIVTLNGGNPYEYGTSAATITAAIQAAIGASNANITIDEGRSTTGTLNAEVSDVTGDVTYTMTYPKQYTVTFAVAHGTWATGITGADASGTQNITVTVNAGQTLQQAGVTALPTATADNGYENGGWKGTAPTLATTVDQDTTFTWSAQAKVSGYTIKRYYQKVEVDADKTYKAADYEYDSSKDIVVEAEVDTDVSLDTIDAANKVPGKEGFKNAPVTYWDETEHPDYVRSGAPITVTGDSAANNVINLYFDRADVKYRYTIGNPSFGPSDVTGIPGEQTVRYGTILETLATPVTADTTKNFGGWKYNNAAVVLPFTLTSDITEFLGEWEYGTYDVQFVAERTIDTAATVYPEDDETAADVSYTVENVEFGTGAGTVLPKPSDEAAYEFTYWTLAIDGVPVQKNGKAVEMNSTIASLYPIMGPNYVFTAHFAKRTYTVTYMNDSPYVKDIVQEENVTVFNLEYGADVPLPGVNNGGNDTNDLRAHGGDRFGNPVMADGATGHTLVSSNGGWKWKTSDQNIGTTRPDGTIKVQGNITFTPNVSAATFTVYFKNTEGSTMASVPSVTDLEYTDSVFKGIAQDKKPMNPEYAAGGKTFTGWRVSSTNADNPNGATISPDTDQVVSGIVMASNATNEYYLFAQWENAETQVSYYANLGNDDLVHLVAARVSDTPVLPSATSLDFSKEGYTFVGWTSDKENTGTVYHAATTEYTVVDDTDDKTANFLYAKWEPITYKVKWRDAEGNVIQEASEDVSQTFTYDAPNQTLSIPASVTAVFTDEQPIGWTLLGETYKDGDAIENLTSKADDVLYMEPKFASRISLTYKPGNVGTDTVTGVPASAVTQLANAQGKATFTMPADPERAGYVFDGWSINGSDDLKKAGNTVELSADGVAVAQWSRGEIEYTIERYLQQGINGTYAKDTSFVPPANLKTAETTASLPEDFDTTLDGYTLITTSPTKLTTAVTPGGENTIKLYYNINSYKVSYVYEGVNGAAVPPVTESDAMAYGTSYTLQAIPNETDNAANWPDGYTTSNTEWIVTDSKGQAVTVGSDRKVTVNDDLTAKLSFTKQSFDVKFHLTNHGSWNDGSAASAVKTNTVEWGGVPSMAGTAVTADSGYDFVGWGTSATATTTVTPTAIPVKSEGVEYWALFKMEKTVTWAPGNHSYDDFDGATASFEELSVGADIPAPTGIKLDSKGNPRAAAGYTFAGWKYNGVTYDNVRAVQNALTVVDEDMIFVAQWEKVDLTATFNNGANAVNPAGKTEKTQKVGDTVTMPAAPDGKPGYTFGGWAGIIDGKDKTYKLNETFTMPGENVSLTAVWNNANVNFTYLVDDAETSKGSVSKPGETNVPAADNNNTYTVKATPDSGYKFVNWTYNDGTNDVAVPVSWNDPSITNKESPSYGLLTIHKNADGVYESGTYTAHFAPDSCKVTFVNSDSSKGTISVSYANNSYQEVAYQGNATTTKGQDAVAGQDRVNWPNSSTDYTFGGWKYTVTPIGSSSPVNVQLDADVDPATVPIVGDTVFTAMWTPKPAIVVYDGNGSNGGSMEEKAGLWAGDSYTLLPVGWTRTGYDSDGYNEAADGSGASYAAGAEITLHAGINKVYVQWAAKDVTIKYHSNPTDTEVAEEVFTDTVVFGESTELATIEETGFEPTDDGDTPAGARTFKEWNTQPSGLGDTVSSPITVGSTTPSDLYAIWQDKTFTIRFNGNGATNASAVSMNDITGVKYKQTVSIPANVFVRNGYTFRGWSDGKGTALFGADGNSSTYTWREGVFDDVVTLSAQWRGDEPYYIEVYFRNDSGQVVDDSMTVAKDNGQSLTAMPMATYVEPTRAGADFQGWTAILKDESTLLDKNATLRDIITTYYTVGNTYGLAEYWDPTANENAGGFTEGHANGAGVKVYLNELFEVSEYTVQFEPNNPDGYADATVTKMADQVVPFSTNAAQKKLKANTYSFPGYRFLGWQPAKNGAAPTAVQTPEQYAALGTTHYDDEYDLKANGDLVTNNNTNLTVTLYAVWEALPNSVEYILTYPGDGVADPSDVTSLGTRADVAWADVISLPANVEAPVAYPGDGSQDSEYADYMFEGWYTAKNSASINLPSGVEVQPGTSKFNEVLTALGVSPAKNASYPLKVYAKWSRNGAKIVYQQGTADSTKNLPNPQASSIGAEGASITLATNTMVKKGSTPNGWLEGSTPRANELAYMFLSTDAGKVVTLTPNFTPNKYTVNYKYDTIVGVADSAITKAKTGTVAGHGTPIVSYNNDTLNLQWDSTNFLPGNIEENNAKTDGYTFEGWYTRDPSDSTAQKVDESWTVEQLAAAVDGSASLADDTDGRAFTLYAKWVPNSYAVNYSLGTNPNGSLLDGTLPTPKQNLKWTDRTDKSGNPIVLSSADIKRDGFSEPEWYMDAAYTVKLSESGSTNMSVAEIAERWRMVSGNETAELPETFMLYAKWKEDTVRITFTLSNTTSGRLKSYNGGSGTVNYPANTTQVVYEVGAYTGEVYSATGNAGAVTTTATLPKITPTVIDNSGFGLTGEWIRTDGATPTAVPSAWISGNAITIPDTGNNTTYGTGTKYVTATYVATVDAISDTSYKVAAIYQNADGTWPEEALLADTQTRTGATGTTVSPDDEQSNFTRAGFEYQQGATPAVQIAADGSTVLQLKYARVAHDVFFEYQWEGTPEVATPSAPDTKQNVRYGAEVALPEAAAAPSGYKFDGWYATDADGNPTGNKLQTNPIMGIEDMTLVGKWVRTTYKVVFDTSIKDEDGVAVSPEGASVVVSTVGTVEAPVEIAAGKLLTSRLAGYKITLIDSDDEGGSYDLGTNKPNADVRLDYSSLSYAISWAYTMGDDPTEYETLDPTSVPINGDTTFRVVANNTPIVKYLVGEHGTFEMSSDAGTLFKPEIPEGSTTYSLNNYLYAGPKDTRGADVTANNNLPTGEPGWKFVGWKYTYIKGSAIEQGNNLSEADVLSGGIRDLALTNSITLEAQWEPAESMLVFDLGDNTYAEPNWVSPEKNKTGTYPTFDGKAEHLVTLPDASDVIREGYTLTKWVYDDGTTTAEYAPGGTFQMPAKDKNQVTTLTAKYAEDTVELRYVPSPATSGSVSLTSERVGVWTGIVAGSDPAVTAEGSTAIPNPGGELLKWAKGAPNGATITAGVTGTTLVPQFSGSSPIASKNSDGGYDSVLFYAVFQGKEYKVTFSSADTNMGVICDKNGTEHNPLTQQMRFGTYVDTSNMVLTPKLGYEASDGNFWNFTMKQVVGVDGDGQDIINVVIGSTSDPASVKVEGDIDFVANLKESDGAYTVIYETNSPDSAFSSVKRKWSEGNLVSGKTPRYAGHTFDGWFAYVNDGTGSYVKTPVSDQTYGDIAGSQDVAEITIFAEWTVINDYALNFDVNSTEATDAIPVATGQTQHNKLTGMRWTSAVNSGTVVDFQMNPPTWRGHTLLGWYTAPEGGMKVLDASYAGVGAAYSTIATACGVGDDPANVPTVYAQWSTTKYNVHYRDVDGTELVTPAPEFAYDQRGIGSQAEPEAPANKIWRGWVYYAAEDTVHTNPIPVTSTTTVKDILDVNGDNADDVSVYATWGDVYIYTTVYHLYEWDEEASEWVETYDDSWYYRHSDVLVHDASAPAGTKVNVTTPSAGAVPGYNYSAELTATWNNPVDYELQSDHIATFPEDIIPQTRFSEALFHVAFTTESSYYVAYDMGDEETFTPYNYTHPATHYPTISHRSFTADHNIPVTTDENGREVAAVPQRPGFIFAGWANREITDDDLVKGLDGIDTETDVPMAEADNLVVPDVDTYYGDLAVSLEGSWYDPAITDRTVTLFARWDEAIHTVQYGIADDTPAGVLEIRLTKDADVAASYINDGLLEESVGAATGDSFIDGERIVNGTIGATARVVKRGYEFGGWRVYSTDKPVSNGFDYFEVYGTGEGDTSTASIDTSSVANRINDTDALSVAAIGVSSEDAAPYTGNTVMTPGVTSDNDLFAGSGVDEDSSASDVLYVATVKQRSLVKVTYNPGDTEDVVYTGPESSEQPSGTYVGETPKDDVWGNNPGSLPSDDTISREGFTFGGWIVPAGTKYVDSTGEEKVVPEGGLVVKPTDDLASRIIVPEEGLTLDALWTQVIPPNKDALQELYDDTKDDPEDGTHTSVDGTDLWPTDEWVTPEIKTELEDALQEAKEVLDNPDATQEEIDAAYDRLREASEAYEQAKKPGTKQNMDNPDNPDPDNPNPDNPNQQGQTDSDSTLNPTKIRPASSNSSNAPLTGDSLVLVAGGLAGAAVLALVVALFARRRNEEEERS